MTPSLADEPRLLLPATISGFRLSDVERHRDCCGASAKYTDDAGSSTELWVRHDARVPPDFDKKHTRADIPGVLAVQYEDKAPDGKGGVWHVSWGEGGGGDGVLEWSLAVSTVYPDNPARATARKNTITVARSVASFVANRLAHPDISDGERTAHLDKLGVAR